jgi:hypothetical protein
MRTKLLCCVVSAAGILAVSVPMLAHHGTDAAYDTSKRVTLKGTVTKFIWANPHCGVLFDVTDDQGNVTHWGGEDTNPHALSLAGWTREILKPGDKITITGAPSRFNEPRIEDEQVVLADGRVLKGLLSHQAGNTFPGIQHSGGPQSQDPSAK